MSVAAPSPSSFGVPTSVTASVPSLPSPASYPLAPSSSSGSGSASTPAAQPPIFSEVAPSVQRPSPAASPPISTPLNFSPKSVFPPSLPSLAPTGDSTPATVPVSEIPTPTASSPPTGIPSEQGRGSPSPLPQPPLSAQSAPPRSHSFPPLPQSPPPAQPTIPPANLGTSPLPILASPPAPANVRFPPFAVPISPPPHAASPSTVAASPVSNPSLGVPSATVFPASPPPPSAASRGSPPISSHPPLSANKTLSGIISNGSGSNGGNGASTSVIVGIAVGGALIVGLIAFVILCLTKKRSKGDLSRNRRAYQSHAAISGSSERDHSQAGVRRYGPGSAYSSSSDAINNLVFPPPPPPPPPIRASHFVNDNGVEAADAGPRKSPQGSSFGNSRSWFTYEELEVATNGFSKGNLLGEGGFGLVFKGHLKGGRMVAVKQLKLGGAQGDREFRAEVEIINRIHHRHLVSLVGYCIADTQRLLVYDYVPNGTLEYHLHEKGRPVIEWGTRLKIATGAARGLAYLHEDCHPRVIHRDIKSSNILLDYNFEAQVSDFGLAKLASDAYTHVTTRVMGTFGYLAPEYASSGKLTNKSDVYSFGVVLLELITGCRPIDTSQPLGQESLVEWARPLLSRALEGKNLEALADPRLASYDYKEMLRMVEAAAACVRHSAHKRPQMGQVVHALESEIALSVLNQESKPGDSAYQNSIMSIDFDSTEFSIDMKGFQRRVQNNQESSSEYSGIATDTSRLSSTENPQRDRRFTNWLGRVSQKGSSKQRSSTRFDEVEQPLRM